MSKPLLLPSATRVMVVDDNQHMRVLVSTILAGFGVRLVREAGDGAEALELAIDDPPDIVIVDYRMPIIDGLEFTRFVRRGPPPLREAPIVLMTGHTERALVELARDTGVTEVLTKPLTAKELFLKLQVSLVKPREFVKTPTFSGPDRRRRSDPMPACGRRRTDRFLAPPEEEEPAPEIMEIVRRLESKRNGENAETVDRLIETLRRRRRASDLIAI